MAAGSGVPADDEEEAAWSGAALATSCSRQRRGEGGRDLAAGSGRALPTPGSGGGGRRGSDCGEFVNFIFFFIFLFFRAVDISNRTEKIRFSRAGPPPARKNHDFRKQSAACGPFIRTRKSIHLHGKTHPVVVISNPQILKPVQFDSISGFGGRFHNRGTYVAVLTWSLFQVALTWCLCDIRIKKCMCGLFIIQKK